MLQRTTTAGDLSDARSVPAAEGLRRAGTRDLRGKALAPIAVVVCAMLLGAFYTFAMGEDVNWDWQNYHEYNVWAVLNGRYGVDAVPPGFQTYFNPIVYFPVYYLRHFLPSPYGLMILGAIHGLNLALICLFARLVLREAATVAAIAAAVVIAAFGPMTLSEVGTSFSDVLLALPVIGGFLLILVADRRPAACHLLAGLLIGAAVGLKLTNVVYAVGAAAAVLAAARPLRATALLAIGGIVGAALTGGEWCLITWRDTGNPIFPLFNAVFKSNEVAAVNLMDAQFMPHGLLDALAYPFYWLVGDHRGAEHPFRDARFAVVTVLFVLGLLVRMIRGSAILTRRDVQLVVMFAVSYLAWLGLFAIQRYAVVLELLCAPVIVVLLARLAASAGLWPATSSLPLNAVMVTVAAAIASWSQPADWWHRPWSDIYRPAIADELAQPATYFILGKPLAYIAPQLPAQSRFYLLADIGVPIVPGGLFDQRIRAGLKSPLPGGVRELHMRGEPDRSALLDRYALTIDRARPCVSIEGARPGTVLESCPLIERTAR
jgi:hypothetical protein